MGHRAGQAGRSLPAAPLRSHAEGTSERPPERAPEAVTGQEKAHRQGRELPSASPGTCTKLGPNSGDGEGVSARNLRPPRSLGKSWRGHGAVGTIRVPFCRWRGTTAGTGPGTHPASHSWNQGRSSRLSIFSSLDSKTRGFLKPLCSSVSTFRCCEVKRCNI